MKAIMRFFLSLKTSSVFFIVLIVILVAGSLYLPSNLAFFSGIDDIPLFRWLSESGNIKNIWWIYALILMLALLGLSTILCTAEALLKKLSRRGLLLKLSTQIIHIGVLFILLGHLLTASAGFKADVVIKKGEEKPVTDKASIHIKDISVQTDANGYFTDWEAKLWWIENGRKLYEKALRPAHPLYFGQLGLYIKSVSAEPDVSVQIRVCRDPGALWALIGGFLLSAGGIGFLCGRFRG